MTYKPESIEVLAQRGFKAIQDAFNSGYILGNRNAEMRIIAIIESEKWASDSLKEDIENLKQLIKGEQK